MINASGSEEGSAKGDEEEQEEKQAVESGAVSKPSKKLRKKKAKKDGKGLKTSTTDLRPKIDAKGKQAGKGYVDIYSGLNEGEKKMNVVTEALYNQYKERSRRFIQQQQQKAKTMAS